MHHTKPHPRRPSPIRRLMTWLRIQRKECAHQVLRGASYGAGTTAVSLFALWYQNR